MGWSYGYTSKADLIERLTKTWESDFAKQECLRKCWRGNRFSGNLWTVWQTTYPDRPAARFVVLIMMKAAGTAEWGYKDVSECAGPYEYSCPLSYLDLLTEPANEYAARWREDLRKHYAEKPKPKVGEVWSLHPNTGDYSHAKITSLKPLFGTFNWGYKAKLTRRLLKNRIPFPVENRSSTALGLLEAIRKEQAFDRLPILADALEDAGYQDEFVLKELRKEGEVDGKIAEMLQANLQP